MNYKILEKLCNAHGVSGYETEVMKLICELIYDYADSIEFDSVGNLIAFKKGTEGSCGKTVLYSAHADEVGFVIKHINDDGTLLFDALGMSTSAYAGARVLVGKSKLPGVVSTKPFHLVSDEERAKPISSDELSIYIGAKDKKQAEELSVYADYAVFDSCYEDFGDGMIKTKALDDRAGCALLIELIMRGVKHDSYFAFCTSEEIGLRGSHSVAHTVKPDICINLECTTAGDIYGKEGAEKVCSVGSGPVVPFMDGASVYNPTLYRMTHKLACELNIPIQTKSVVAGGTDAGSYMREAGGCRVIGIAVPTRYLHSAYLVASKKDIDAACDLLFAVSDRIDEFADTNICEDTVIPDSICDIKNISGSDVSVLPYIKKELGGFCDEIFADSIGNVYALKKGADNLPKRRIAVVCPVDEAGFVVRYVGEKILLHCIGEKPFSKYCGKTGITQNGIPGVIKTTAEDMEKCMAGDFYFETDSNENISAGDFIGICEKPENIDSTRVSVGNAGRKVISRVLFDLAKSGSEYSSDVYYVFAAQHILSGRGHVCSSYNMRPDTVIALDFAEGKAGEGPVIDMSESSAVLSEKLVLAAERSGIHAQSNAKKDKSIQSVLQAFSWHGAECAKIAVPLEKDGEKEICDTRDINGAGAIICTYMIFEDQKGEDK